MSDYGLPITLTFAPCARETCGTLTINDDNAMEEQREEFTVFLQSAIAETRVTISTMPSTVVISDDDGMCVRVV